MWYIYKITNKINGKVYIGQTTNPNLRWSRHKSNAKHKPLSGNLHLISAMNEHGIEFFVFEILEKVVFLNEADQREIELIKQYNSTNREFGYNKSPGGRGKSAMSQEIKDKISKKLKGRIPTMLGKHHSKETKDKISAIKKGNKYCLGIKRSEYTKKLLSEINTGKKASNETVLKMSKSMMGKNLGENNGMYGKPSPLAKLTKEQAINIRSEYALGGISMQKIAGKYGVSKKTILNIIHGKIFK